MTVDKTQIRINGRELQMKEVYGLAGESTDDALCLVCMCSPKNMIFKPCSHMCVCEPCAYAM